MKDDIIIHVNRENMEKTIHEDIENTYITVSFMRRCIECHYGVPEHADGCTKDSIEKRFNRSKQGSWYP